MANLKRSIKGNSVQPSISDAAKALSAHAVAAASDVLGAREKLEARVKVAQALASDNAEEVATQGAIGQVVVMHLSLSDVDENPFDACPIKDDQVIKDLCQSMALHGQKQPVLVVRSSVIGGSSSRWIIVEGGHRRIALTLMGSPTIKAIEMPEVDSERALFEISHAVNDSRRGKPPAYVNALAWSRALQGKFYSDALDLATRNRIDKSIVSRTLAILKLPESALTLIKRDPARVNVRLGYAVYQYFERFGEEQTLELLGRIYASGSAVTVESVEWLVEQGKPRRESSPKKSGNKFDVSAGGVTLGRLRHWPHTGRISVDIVIADEAEGERYLARLKEALAVK